MGEREAPFECVKTERVERVISYKHILQQMELERRELVARTWTASVQPYLKPWIRWDCPQQGKGVQSLQEHHTQRQWWKKSQLGRLRKWWCSGHFPFALPSPLSILPCAQGGWLNEPPPGAPALWLWVWFSPQEARSEIRSWGESEAGVFTPLALSLLGRLQLVRGCFPREGLLTAPTSRPSGGHSCSCLQSSILPHPMLASPIFVKSPLITLPSMILCECAHLFPAGILADSRDKSRRL